MMTELCTIRDKPPCSCHSERSPVLCSAEDGTQSRNLLFGWRKKRFLDSTLEMTMRNFHGEYVGARVLARAGVNKKW
jgi:hypothetical protein